MLSVIQALEQWCYYLEGARHQFEIWNDHANLQWFMQRQDHQETFKVLVYLDIYGQVIISLMLVDKCIYSIVYLKS